MPVIINDFEIVVDAAPPQQPAAPQPQAPPPSNLRPEDIIRIQRHEQERRERVRAD